MVCCTASGKRKRLHRQSPSGQSDVPHLPSLASILESSGGVQVFGVVIAKIIVNPDPGERRGRQLTD